MALSGPPPLTAAGDAALSGVVEGPDILTTSPAELLSFYTGVNSHLAIHPTYHPGTGLSAPPRGTGVGRPVIEPFTARYSAAALPMKFRDPLPTVDAPTFTGPRTPIAMRSSDEGASEGLGGVRGTPQGPTQIPTQIQGQALHGLDLYDPPKAP